jgi:hypothetical protein
MAAPLTQDEIDQFEGNTPQPAAPITGAAAAPVATTPLTQDEIDKFEQAPTTSTSSPAQNTPVMRPIPDYDQPSLVGDIGRMLTAPFHGVADRVSAGLDTVFGTGLPNKTNLSPSEEYARNLQNERWQDQRVASQYPVMSPVLGTVGGVAAAAALAPDAITAPAAAGAGALLKPLVTGAYSAGLGAAQSATNAPDLTNTPDVLNRAKIGAEEALPLGLAVPAVGGWLGKGAAGLLTEGNGYPAGISRNAANPLLTVMGKADPQQAIANMTKLGPEATLADSSVPALGATMELYAKDLQSRGIIDSTLQPREANTVARLYSDIQNTIGPPVSPAEIQAQINSLRGVEHAKLPGIWPTAPAVDSSSVLDTVNKELPIAAGQEKTALEKLRSALIDQQGTPAQPPKVTPPSGTPGSMAIYQRTPAVPPTPATAVSNAEKLQNIKVMADDMMSGKDPVIGNKPGAVAKADGAVSTVRQQINQLLRDNVPGYSGIMDTSAAAARKADAMEDGYENLLTGGNTPMEPFTLQQKLNNAIKNKQPEVAEGYKLGATGAIYNHLGTNVNDLAKLKSDLQLAPGQSVTGPKSLNQEKLEMLFGPDSVKKLADTVDRNQQFRTNYNDIARGSMTQIRQGGADALQPPVNPNAPSFFDPRVSPLGLTLAAGKKVAGAVAAPYLPQNAPSFPEVAKVLTTPGAQGMSYAQALAQALRNRTLNQRIGGAFGNTAALAAALQGYNTLDNNFNPIPPVEKPQ